jgi:predicted aminopeptidase
LKRNINKFPLLIALLLALSQVSCIGYLCQAAGGQFKILSENIPIEKVIQNPQKYAISGNDLVKLKDVAQVKEFAEKELGLAASGNYRNFKKLKDKYVAYQVSASDALALKPYTWYFPIAGRVPYLGFFSKEGQMLKAKNLMQKGYDVRLQNIIAYSTLGWFKDPLLSSMLLLSREELINTIIHEMAHATIYFPGDTDFNESVATFLGDEGAVLYLQKKLGQGNIYSKRIADEKYDERIFSEHMKKIIADLTSLYHSAESREEKLKKKWQIIKKGQDELRARKNEFRTKVYYFFFDPKFHPNNAHFLAYRRYILDQSLFIEGYRKHQNDYVKYLQFLKSLVKKGEGNYKEILRKELAKLSEPN